MYLKLRNIHTLEVARIHSARLGCNVPQLKEHLQANEPILFRLFLRIGNNRESEMAVRF